MIKNWPRQWYTFDSGRVPDPVLMSGQAGWTFFKFTEVTLKELSELWHIHHFAMGEPSIKGNMHSQKIKGFNYMSNWSSYIGQDILWF